MAPARPSPRALLAFALLVFAACSRGAVADVRAPGPTATEPASGCPSPTAAGRTPLIRSGSNGCAEAAAVLSRCARRLDPVITFLGPNGRRYLGGRFATPVRALPSGAAFVGRAGDLEVYRQPGLGGRVFVVAAEGITRWLELPGPGRLSAASVSVIGDSIALGSAEEIVDALPEWTTSIDAEIGRASEAGVPVAAAIAGPGSSPSAVVVELGTNDENLARFVTSARTILRPLREIPLVVWVAPHAPFETTAGVRAAIDRLVASTPNAVVADWDAAVPPDALAEDDVHLLPDRVDVFADFIARDLRAWRMAVTGSGATACAPTA